MRVAIFGTGSIGVRHARNLVSLGCEVSGFDRSVGSLSALPAGVVAIHLTDRVGIAPTDFDAIVVATPWDQHLGWSRMAITNRIPTFIEKPLGTLDEISEWRELNGVSGRAPVQVGYQCRFHPKARAMREIIPSPVAMHVACDCDMATWHGSYGDGMLECSHDLDLALHFGLGPITWARTSHDYASVRAKNGSIWMQWNARQYRRAWSMHDERSAVDVAFDSPGSLGDQMYVDELKHFLDCVREGKQTDVPLSDGLRVLEVCAEIERTAMCPA